MKKLVAGVLVAAMLMMAGCGESERVITGNAESGSAQNSEGTAAQGDGAGQTSQKGYVFTSNGTAIAADADMAPIVAALGEPNSYFEAASCAFEGLDKIYTYSGFEINTYPTDDKDYVSSVVLKDDSVTTTEGICIGDSLEKVKQTYGEGTEETGMTVYEKDGMKLCFIVKDGSVAAIEYRSTVLE